MEAINLILKNTGTQDIELQLIDQYGGNFSATIPPETAQNHTLKKGSEIKINEQTIHIVKSEDANQEIIINT